MDIETAVMLVDQVVYRYTQKHLNDLQQAIIIKVWQGEKYLAIADEYSCTEGHAKDTGSLLWKILSEAWGKKVTKSNFRSLIKQQLKSLSNLEINRSNNLINSPASINFLGRQSAIAWLQNLIAQGCKVIVLQGEGGVGKTTLAQQFLAQQGFELTLEVLMAKETANIIAVASVVEEWLQRDLKEESGKEFGVTLARLKRYLEQHRVGILIDNLEPALDQDGRLIAAHRDYLELLRILADPKVQSVTIITSRDRLCEGEINLEHYRLSGLDVDSKQQRQVIKSLRHRSLLEFAQGQYWLHPVVQAEARLRLQPLPESWQQAHRQIAIYLTDSVTRINDIQAGLTALEAYYHYQAIQDYTAAAKVILHSRENQWGQFLTLGTTLYRLGIIQPLLTAINQIIEQIDHDRQRSELHNILGDLYWTTGKIQQAIACQQKTIITSQNCLQSIPSTLENKHDLYY